MPKFVPLVQKGNFFRKLTNMTNVWLLHHIILKLMFLKISRAVHVIKNCIILDQIWPILLQKELLFRKITKATFVYLLCFIMIQNLKRSTEIKPWDIRLHSFSLDWAQIARLWFWGKEDFWGKLTNANFVNLPCPIIPKMFQRNYDRW